MRFRLRTLLIVITVGAMLFARVGYLKQKARFHRREALQIALGIATVENDSVADVARAMRLLAEGRPAPNTKLGSGSSAVFGYGLHVRSVAGETAFDWRRAIWHSKMAYEYDQDVFRLWPGPKPEPPVVPLFTPKI